MTIKELDILLRQPHQISGEDGIKLKAIIDQYPYFQSVRSLYLKSLYVSNSFNYNNELKTTAAHTLDRDILFDFIISPDFISYQPLQIKESQSKSNKTSQTTDTVISIDDNVLITDHPINTPSIEITEDKENIAKDNNIEEESPLQIEEEKEVLNSEPKLTSTAIKSLLQSITIHENQQLLPSITKDIQHTADKLLDVIDNSKQEAITQLEEKLEIGAPLNFDDKEKLSFTEWLQLSKSKPIDRENDSILTDIEQNTDIEKQKKIELIDKFIETNPKIVPTKKATVTPINIDTSVQENSSLMTETLAKIYLEQKKYQKAIQAYEILILKYPEKSSFFANQISDIKALQQYNS
ncbi:hypothetical protein LNQ81_03615 [Myroides sp. M-43]|uniref:tetratricopeptide repeat protein n=1 Tax=Myroides oncorhynchi TaxID=2893756 RepID=UPI001E3CED97|nr:tetratricopeptide repeat protein [Myroides oncorhynchi]MCC9041787.1 hypothetical protein [Myroides oncorhynchi]